MTANPRADIGGAWGLDSTSGAGVPVVKKENEERIWLRAIAMILVEAYQLPNDAVWYYDAANSADLGGDI